MSSNRLKILNKELGSNQPSLIIAEIGQAHDGSLGMAHSYIESLASIKVDAVKFQTHFANEESSTYDQFRVNFSYQDKTRYDYWKRLEFSDSEWAELKKHCDEKGIIFLSSPFSFRAVELLKKLNMQAWKIASGEISNIPMLEEILTTNKPLILSNGLCTYSELKNIVERCRKENVQFGILQCTSEYPCDPINIDINNILKLKKALNCPVGLSDHSGTIYPALAAMSLGAELIEVHVTYDKRAFGPDSKASLTFDQLEQIVEAKDYFHKLFKPTHVSKNKIPLKKLFGKSFYASKNIQRNEIFSWSNVQLLKPEKGVKAKDFYKLIGAPSNKIIRAGEPIKLKDIR